MTPTGFHLPPGLLDRLACSGIHVCPTLGRVPGLAPPPAIQAVLERMGGATWEDLLARIGAMHRAGVTMVSGVDAGIGPGKPHGLLPVAVSQLVDCGVPVEAALASTTSVAAGACHLEQRTGRLAVGLDADLLLVDGDPLTDIDCLQHPRAVVSRRQEVLRSGGATVGPPRGTDGP